jgi:hypothetical protein
MIIAKLPFGQFIELLRRSGRDQGFIFLVIFIAREADCPEIFRQLERTWSSLHDLTSSEILFLTIDGTTSSPSPMEGDRQYRLRDDVGFVNNSRGSIIYSPECRLLQRLEGINVQYNREFIDLNTRPTRRDATWRDEQTLGISPLLSILKEVQENDVPCLYFESLLSNHRFNVPIKSINNIQLSIYELLKLTSNRIRPRMSKMRENFLLIKDLWNSISRIQASIKLLKTEPSHTIKKLIYSKSWLEEWSKSNEFLNPKIFELINRSIAGNLRIIDVYSGISHLKKTLDAHSLSELRSHLNKMVDCRHLLGEIADLENIKSTNQILIQTKQAEIHKSKDQISQLEKAIIESSHQAEHIIKLAIQDKASTIKNESRQVTEQPRRIIYAEKYFERVEDGYHENSYTTETNTKAEIQIMSGDRHINMGSGNYVESNTGVYVQGNYIGMGQDLTQAAAQIQDLIEQLQKRGMTVDVAQEQVGKDMATQAQSNSTVKDKLVKWGQSLGDATVSDVVKGAVKLAIRSAGIPLP